MPPGPDELVNTVLAAELASVSPVTITTWARRGYVDVFGSRVKLPVAAWTTYHGRPAPLYRVIDVAKAEQATHRRARRNVRKSERAAA